MTPEQRSDARDALALLEGSGLTLVDAAKRALHGRRALDRVSVEDACDRFLRFKLKSGDVRPKTLEWYETQLNHLQVAFGGRKLDELDKPTLKPWFDSLLRQKQPAIRAVRALVRWAIAQTPPMATTDPTVGESATVKRRGGEATILTVEDAQRVMEHAGEYRAALALMLFAGVRPDEVRGRQKEPLRWKHVDLVEQTVRIPAEIAKNNATRVLEQLPETLWRFLPTERPDPETPICPSYVRQATNAAKAAILAPWTHDVLRHTFGTYALNHTQDAGRVALWLGHNGDPTMLHRHYKGLCTRAEAQAFFAISPK